MAIPLPPPISVPGAYPLPPAVPLAQPTFIPPLAPPSPPGVVDTSQDIPEPTAPTLAEPSQEALDQVEALQQAVQAQEEQRAAEEALAEEERATETEETQTEETSGNPAPEAGSADVPDAAPPAELVPELAEVQTVEIFGFAVPLPRTEILVTATSTAAISSVAAVGGTLFATTLFRKLLPLLKPIFKTILKKVAKIRKKPPPKTWARLRLESRRNRQNKTGSPDGS